MKKVLVTGATGFIGRHLVERLVKEGFSVRCLVRPESRSDFLKNRKNIELAIGDLLDHSSLAKAAAGVEEIFHLGAISQTREDIDYRTLQKTNVFPTVFLAREGLKNRAKKFIYFSSIEAVGLRAASNIINPIDEFVVPRPETKYGRSKLEAERELLEYYRKEKLPVVIIRPSVIYGPGDLTHGPIKLLRLIKSGKFHFVGSGNNLVSWCYVENLIEGVIRAAKNPVSSGQIYFIGDEKPYYFREIVYTAADILGIRISPWKIPLFVAKIICLPIEITFSLLGKDPPLSRSKLRLATQNFVYNIGKAKKDLHYRQLFSLKEGMKKTIAWYKDHGYL